MKKIKEIYNANWEFFPQLIALLIPFGINSAIVVLLWLALFFLCYNVTSALKRLTSNKWFYVFLTFFLIHAIGAFFSVNKEEAISAIEIKLSFIAFPFLLFSHQLQLINMAKVLITFVSSCFLACAFLIFRALYLYVFEGVYAFYYSDFSYFLHPSYFSMYLLCALVIVVLYYKSWLSHLKYLNTKISFTAAFFILCIFLSASKIGLAAFFITTLIMLSVWFYQKGLAKWIVISVIASFIILFFVSKLNLGPIERIKIALSVTTSGQEIDKTATESTAVRLLIWEQAIKIIKSNPIFGITAGDTNDALYKAYEQNGLTGAFEKKLNAHNQYFQTFIGTGIVGFTLLILITLYFIIHGFVKKNYLLCLFGFIITLNFLVESMLQTQAGVIFFVFFSCILLRCNFYKST